jgi:hypothetical protein
MSVRQNIAKWISGQPSTPKAAVAPPAPQAAPVGPPPTVFLSANLKHDTDTFLLVFGEYNFAVCKGFAQPVVAIMGDWKSEYASVFPFTQAKQIEIVISRTPPETPGATDARPDMREAARVSANRDTNIGFLLSLLRDRWICGRSVLSNGGIFEMAEERFASRNFPTLRATYLKRFANLSDVRTRHVSVICEPPPPARSLNPPVRRVCKNQHEWDSLPAEEQARMLAEEQSQWQHQYAPAWGNSRRTSDIGITAPPPSFDVDDRTTTENWNQAPTPEERIGTEGNDWK